MNIKHYVFPFILNASGFALGSVTLGFFDNPANKFADANGNPANGLFYGVIIDTGRDGFDISYRPVALAHGMQAKLTTSSDMPSDDVLYVAEYLTYRDPDLHIDGTIYDVGPIDFSDDVDTGDVFRIVWFDGDSIGTLGDDSFTIPDDGATASYTAPFVVPNPIRSAAFSYYGTSGIATGSGFSFASIPEPASALLAAFSSVALFRRRRY